MLMASLKQAEIALAQYANGTGDTPWFIKRIREHPLTVSKRLKLSPHLLSFLLTVVKIRPLIALNPVNLEQELPEQVEEISRESSNTYTFSQSQQLVSSTFSWILSSGSPSRRERSNLEGSTTGLWKNAATLRRAILSLRNENPFVDGSAPATSLPVF